MAIRIRLTRTGCKKRPFYRIVAINSETRRDGRPLEFIGHYNPMVKPAQIEVDMDKYNKWLGLGAQVSDTVKSLLRAKS